METVYKITLDVSGDTTTDYAAPQTKSIQAIQKSNSSVLKSGNSASNVAVIHLGKKAAQYGLSNYGNLTGNYIGQQKAQDGVTLFTYGAAIAAGGALGAVYVGADMILNVATNVIDRVKQNQTAEMLRARAGISVSGGRGI